MQRWVCAEYGGSAARLIIKPWPNCSHRAQSPPTPLPPPPTAVAMVGQRQPQPHRVQRVRERGGGHACAGPRQQAAWHAQFAVLVCQ